MFKTPLHKRLQASARFKARYHSDHEFRLSWLNKKRAEQGRPMLTDIEPVGQARPAWAASRQRDDRGRFA